MEEQTLSYRQRWHIFIFPGGPRRCVPTQVTQPAEVTVFSRQHNIANLDHLLQSLSLIACMASLHGRSRTSLRSANGSSEALCLKLATTNGTTTFTKTACCYLSSMAVPFSLFHCTKCRYILVYPQGCDVCNHLSLFLCVADYDKLLPGMLVLACMTCFTSFATDRPTPQ